MSKIIITETRNMKMTVILIILGAFGTFPIGLVKRLLKLEIGR